MADTPQGPFYVGKHRNAVGLICLAQDAGCFFHIHIRNGHGVVFENSNDFPAGFFFSRSSTGSISSRYAPGGPPAHQPFP